MAHMDRRRAVAAAGLLLASCAHVKPTDSPLLRIEPLARTYQLLDLEVQLAGDEATRSLVREERDRTAVQLTGAGVTSAQVVGALQSADVRLRKTAAILLAVRGKPGDDELQAMLARYREGDDYFLRYYSLLALSRVDDRQAASASVALAGALVRERDAKLRLLALSLVARMKRDDGLRVLAEYSATGAPDLVLASYGAARTIGDDFACALLARLASAPGSDAFAVAERLDRSKNGAKSPMKRCFEEQRRVGREGPTGP
jgi:hypothetical protein